MQISVLNVVLLLVSALEGREDTQNGGSEQRLLKNNDQLDLSKVCDIAYLRSTKSLMKISS